VIKLGNLHSTSLGDELQFWQLGFLLLSSFVIVMFQGKPFAVYVLHIQIIQQQPQCL